MDRPNSQRKKLADEFERLLGGDELPSMWSIHAQDMRLIIEALREERSGPAERDAKDAARYRYARENLFIGTVYQSDVDPWDDAAIDAAMSAATERSEP